MPGAWEIQTNPKLLVGMPHKDSVGMEWALSFRNLQINVPSVFTTSRGTPIDMARNEIVKAAKDHGVEWLFFLIPSLPTSLCHLLKSRHPQQLLLQSL